MKVPGMKLRVTFRNPKLSCQASSAVCLDTAGRGGGQLNSQAVTCWHQEADYGFSACGFVSDSAGHSEQHLGEHLLGQLT